MRAGQSSAELLVVLGVSLIAILGFAAVAASFISDTSFQQNFDAARQSVQKVATAADAVYLQGPGSTANVTIELPSNTVFGPNYTYIGKPSNAPGTSPSNAININVDGTDVTAYSRSTVTGAFPSAPGSYTIRLRSYGGYVAIGSSLVSVSPDSIRASLGSNQTKLYYLNVTVYSQNPALVNLTYSWPYSSPLLSIPVVAFSSFNGTVVPLVLNFTSNSTVSGIYSSEIVVSVSNNASSFLPVETIRVPVTAEVGVS